jgi:hypothetical protein
MAISINAHAKDFYYGFHLGGTSLQGDLKERNGYNLGLNMAMNLGRGNEVSSNISYQKFSNVSHYGLIRAYENPPNNNIYHESTLESIDDLSSISFVINYSKFFSEKVNQGFYLSLGAGYSRNVIKYNYIYDKSILINGNELPDEFLGFGLGVGVRNSAVYTAGLGYFFPSNIGIEARYDNTKYGNSDSIYKSKGYFNTNLISINLIKNF